MRSLAALSLCLPLTVHAQPEQAAQHEAEQPQHDPYATNDDETIGSTSREILGWSLTPVVDAKGRIAALFGEFDQDRAVGANIRLLHLERTADRNHWKLSGWPAATDRDAAASWVADRHGDTSLRFHHDAEDIDTNHTNPPDPAPIRGVLFATDPIAANLETAEGRHDIAQALATMGYPIAPDLILFNAGPLRVRDNIHPDSDPEGEDLSVLGDNISLNDPITISMIANHIVSTSEPVLIRSTEHAARP